MDKKDNVLNYDTENLSGKLIKEASQDLNELLKMPIAKENIKRRGKKDKGPEQKKGKKGQQWSRKRRYRR